MDDELSACQNQVIGNNIDEKITGMVDNAVKTVENCMHDVLFRALDNVNIPRVEIAVRSITGSSRHGPNSTEQKHDRKDFIGNTDNTPLKSTFAGLDLNIDLDRINETLLIENFEDGNFPALGPNYDRQAHAHHRRPGFPAKILSGFLGLFVGISRKTTRILQDHDKLSGRQKCGNRKKLTLEFVEL